MRKHTVTEASPLLECMVKVFSDTKKSRLKEQLQEGCVFVNGQSITQFNHLLQLGDQLVIDANQKFSLRVEPKFDVKIIFEDEAILVAEKPSGLLTIATEKVQTRTAFFAVNDYLNRQETKKLPFNRRAGGDRIRKKQVFIVHRLDKDASGILLFAKSWEAKLFLQDNWDKFQKQYSAVVEGKPKEPFGKVESYLKENKILRVFSDYPGRDSKHSITHYKTVRSSAHYSLMEVKLETGRKHQIRVHMSDLGCPIIGDSDYGAKTDPIKRLALHAAKLQFVHPVSKRPIQFESPVPPAFHEVLKKDK